MTTKAQSPMEEHRVAGMASKEDDAERRCFRPGTSATCHNCFDLTMANNLNILHHPV